MFQLASTLYIQSSSEASVIDCLANESTKGADASVHVHIAL